MVKVRWWLWLVYIDFLPMVSMVRTKGGRCAIVVLHYSRLFIYLLGIRYFSGFPISNMIRVN